MRRWISFAVFPRKLVSCHSFPSPLDFRSGPVLFVTSREPSEGDGCRVFSAMFHFEKREPCLWFQCPYSCDTHDCKHIQLR
jgi:hypothetical protein